MLNYQQAYFIKSAPRHRALPDDRGAEVAFLGRSNAGKSSALNCITRKSLARTSKMPGRTQHINIFALDREATCRLVDLPGYGFAKAPKAVSTKWPEMINDYLKSRQSLKGLVLLIDSRHPPKSSDIRVLDWCISDSLPVHILLTKADKLSCSAAKTAQIKLQNEVVSLCVDTPSARVTLQLFSAKSNQGLDELQKKLDCWLDIRVN